LIGTPYVTGALNWHCGAFVMRNQTPLVPSQPAFDGTVYIVLNYFGSRLGRAYCETGEDEADESTTIENILSGQFSHPLGVVAFNTAEGWARDATEDIARAVLDRAQKDRPIGKGAQEFLERALGVIVLGGLNSGPAP
jgi:uncharacterized protein with LGFP repeats